MKYLWTAITAFNAAAFGNDIAHHEPLWVILFSAVAAVFCGAIAWESWRGR